MDIILLLLANIIRKTKANEEKAHNLYELIKDTKIPIMVMSIGAQHTNNKTIPKYGPNCVKLIKLLGMKAKTIGVRGEYTKKVFEQYGVKNVEIVGCPAIFLNNNENLGRVLEYKMEKYISNVGLSFPGNCYDDLSNKIARISAKRKNRVFLQSGEEIVNLSVGFSDNYSEIYKKIFRKESSPEEMKRYFKERILFFNNIPEWHQSLKRCTHFISPRIHGTIMALSAGIPSICITIDSRVKELCDCLGVPNITVEAFTKNNLPNIFKNYSFNGQQFDKNREVLAKKYIKLLKENRLEPSDKLISFVKPYNHNNYGEFLKGKRVVLVGPAPNIVGSKQQKLIDSYDVVVRMNKAYPIPGLMMNDIGSRIDVLYNCLHPSPECGGKLDMEGIKNNVKWLCCPFAPIRGFKNRINNFKSANRAFQIPFHHIETKLYEGMEREMNCMPNTGVATILDLLNYDIKELYITGITFFKGGYYPAYRKYNERQVLKRMEKAGNHEQFGQFKVIQPILLNDKRVKFDETLERILKKGLKYDK